MATKKSSNRHNQRPPSRLKRRRSAWPWHKRLVLHPFTLLVLLCCGVMIAGAVWRASADTIQISAKVSAPLPPSPAVITSPADQQHVTNPSITVEGTCPPNTYVRLFVNGTASGIGQCTGGAFSIQTLLSPGANQLQVKVYNITDDEGPESPPITVYYDVPATPPTPVNPSTPTSSSGQGTANSTFIVGAAGGAPAAGSCTAPLTLVGDLRYQAHYPDEQFSWQVHITSGCSPYQLSIDWGDHQTTAWRNDQLGQLAIDLTHTYKRAGTFQPLLKVTDANGAAAETQLLAVVNARPVAYQSPSFLDVIGRYLWVVLPVYAAVVLMAVSFWLGELQVGGASVFHPKTWKGRRRLK